MACLEGSFFSSAGQPQREAGPKEKHRHQEQVQTKERQPARTIWPWSHPRRRALHSKENEAEGRRCLPISMLIKNRMQNQNGLRPNAVTISMKMGS